MTRFSSLCSKALKWLRIDSSVNEIICHGIPDQTVLKDGDTINLDVTLYHKGFHGDL